MARHSVKQEADIRQCRPCDVERGISSNTWWLWYGLHPGMKINSENFTTWILGLGIQLHGLHQFQPKQVAKPTTNYSLCSKL